MAIQLKNYKDKYGATHDTVYAKITDFNFTNKNGVKEAKFTMCVYANKKAADDCLPALDANPRLSVGCTDVSGAYAYSMTLDDYNGLSV